MERKTLSNEQICQTIKNYIHDSIYRHAVMLDGEWGCGKSYFVKNQLEPLIRQEGRQVINVSLYGIETTQEIDDAIIMEIVSSKMHELPKMGKKIAIPKEFCGAAKSVARQIWKLTGEFRGDAAAEIFDEVGYADNWFYVFDDLERCPMPVTKVLGYINQMVEHSGAKVLIVANEKECGHAYEQSDELKMIAGVMLKEYRVGIPAQDHSVRVNQEANRQRELLEIRRLAGELFAADELYRITREKVVGKTIRFEPELPEVVGGLVYNAFGDMNQNVTDVIKLACTDAMIGEGNRNFRILQYALSGIKQICQIILDLRAEENIRFIVLRDITNSMMRTAIRAKTKHEGFDWDIEWKREEAFYTVDCVPAGKQSGDYYGRMRYYYQSFRFVHTYVLTGCMDMLDAQSALEMYAKNMKAELDERSGAYAQACRGCWGLNEEELRKAVQEMKAHLKAGKYTGGTMLNVIALLLKYYKDYGFDFCQPQELVDSAIAQIRGGSITLSADYDLVKTVHALEGEVKKEFDQYFEQISQAQRDRELQCIKQQFQVFDAEDWSERIRDRAFAADCEWSLTKWRMFAGFFDIHRLIEKMAQGDGKDWLNIVQAFAAIYESKGYEPFLGDIESLEELIDGLKTLKIEDRMLDTARRITCKELGKHLDSLREAAKEKK